MMPYPEGSLEAERDRLRSGLVKFLNDNGVSAASSYIEATYPGYVICSVYPKGKETGVKADVPAGDDSKHYRVYLKKDTSGQRQLTGKPEEVKMVTKVQTIDEVADRIVKSVFSEQVTGAKTARSTTMNTSDARRSSARLYHPGRENPMGRSDARAQNLNTNDARGAKAPPGSKPIVIKYPSGIVRAKDARGTYFKTSTNRGATKPRGTYPLTTTMSNAVGFQRGGPDVNGEPVTTFRVARFEKLKDDMTAILLGEEETPAVIVGSDEKATDFGLLDPWHQLSWRRLQDAMRDRVAVYDYALESVGDAFDNDMAIRAAIINGYVPVLEASDEAPADDDKEFDMTPSVKRALKVLADAKRAKEKS